MPQDFEPYGPSLSHNEDIARNVRLQCLSLAAETGAPLKEIQPTADKWADWVLGTNKKEN
ncbi:hypothetical protein [Gordonia sp. (in: high G+C Gram-positive bacteria)]|uniref:hypothetical protein n=1 Tax=Gordonia sp. (in: high G+C Gram-positive bacteria) TaxID=84139 RepID=UPI0033422E02